MLAHRFARVVTWSVVAALGSLGLAHAGENESHLAHLDGQILITQQPLPNAASPERQIEFFETHRQDVITADEHDEGRWTFRYMAFMTETPRTGELTLELRRAEDDEWITSTRLFASPRLTILSGRASVSADSGVQVGEPYKVALVARRDGERVVLAETRLVTELPPRVASRD